MGKISEQTDVGDLVSTDAFPIARSGNTTGYKALMSKVTEYVLSSTTSIFSLNDTMRNVGYAIFGYVDPRWYGAYCGANFNTNNNTQDDSLGIQAALNTGRNVRLPAGAKLANRVRFMADGQTIFYEGVGSRYNSDYPGQAYVFLPNDLWRGGSSPSTTSLTLSAGTKNLTVRTGLPWVNGMSVIIWNASNRWMQGTVTSYDSGTGALVANITDVVGSGTFASWDVDQSLNCAIDANGYDNVNIQNIAFRGNWALVGATAIGNSGPVSNGGAPGIRGPRAASFVNIKNCSFLNLGNGIGAALQSVLSHRGSSTTSLTIGTGTKNLTTGINLAFTAGMEIGIYNTNSNYMNGTVTSYDPATGALVANITSIGGSGTFTSWTVDSFFGLPISTGAKAVIHNNVLQLRVSGADFIGDIWGHIANSTDVHMDNIYTASCAHSGLSSLLTGYGLTGEIMNARVEYCGYGLGPPGNKKFPTGGACIYYATEAYLNIIGISGDHNHGPTIKAQSVGGRRAQNLTLSGVCAIGSFYTAQSGADNAHFVFDGVDGLTATGITTYRNGVDTAYVAEFRGTNSYVNWQGAGGAKGSGAPIGQWGTSYFNFVTTPTRMTYNVPGVGQFSDANVPQSFNGIQSYTENEFNIGNSGTAFTLNLANGVNQRVTATGNATVTMPAAAVGKSFSLAYRTGAGGFTAAFTGVRWPSGVAPVLTTTASRMDLFVFWSDGTNWYGSAQQNYTV